MGRHTPDLNIVGPDWDEDEWAILKGDYSFLEVQRLIFYLSSMNAAAPVETLEGYRAQAELLVNAVLEMYRTVTLRAGGVPYQRGIERPVVPFTAQGLGGEPLGTIVFLVERGIAHIAPLLAPKATPITPNAAEVGMTTENFRPDDAGEGVLDGATVLRS